MRKRNGGYTLLLAMLLTTFVLAIGVSILSLTRKELLLSTASRDSQIAIAAADTGAECAIYWDLAESAFATSSITVSNGAGVAPTIACNNQTISPSLLPASPPYNNIPVTYSFRFGLGNNTVEDPCVDVMVTKEYDTSVNPAVLRTTVDAAGHNNCQAIGARRVERAFIIRY